jgi:hypothetical protein
MRPYSEFQKDFLQLCEYVLDQDDRFINLGCYTLLETAEEIEEANEEHVCGTPACLAGYLPEVFPKQFKWDPEGDPEPLLHVFGCEPTRACIKALAGCTGGAHRILMADLSDLFDAKWGQDTPDRAEVQVRADLVKQATSYEQLGRDIVYAKSTIRDYGFNAFILEQACG